jgi:hypothetical protein
MLSLGMIIDTKIPFKITYLNSFPLALFLISSDFLHLLCFLVLVGSLDFSATTGVRSPTKMINNDKVNPCDTTKPEPRVEPDLIKYPTAQDICRGMTTTNLDKIMEEIKKNQDRGYCIVNRPPRAIRNELKKLNFRVSYYSSSKIQIKWDTESCCEGYSECCQDFCHELICKGGCCCCCLCCDSCSE